jgi:hypothetical protein
MPCLIALLALISPRLALFAIFLFSNLLSRAFEGWLIPLLGFFLLPWTTLAYAVMWSGADGVGGLEWLVVLFGLLLDLGSYAGRKKAKRR